MIDKAIARAVEGDARNLAALLDCRYRLSDRLREQGVRDQGTILQVRYESRDPNVEDFEVKRSLGDTEIIGRPLGERPEGKRAQRSEKSGNAIPLTDASASKPDAAYASQQPSVDLPRYEPDPECPI